MTARFQAIQDSTWWRRTFPNQNLTAYAGAGWLFHNSQYFARPNNTGRALFRYVAHADLDLYNNKLVLYADTNLFTDRESSNTLNPTELDWIVGIALRWKDTELAFYREEDRPLDQGGLVKSIMRCNCDLRSMCGRVRWSESVSGDKAGTLRAVTYAMQGRSPARPPSSRSSSIVRVRQY